MTYLQNYGCAHSTQHTTSMLMPTYNSTLLPGYLIPTCNSTLLPGYLISTYVQQYIATRVPYINLCTTVHCYQGTLYQPMYNSTLLPGYLMPTHVQQYIATRVPYANLRMYNSTLLAGYLVSLMICQPRLTCLISSVLSVV